MRHADHLPSEVIPLSRPLKVDDVPDEGLDTTLEADASERAAVALAVGLPSIGALGAAYRVSRRPHGRLRVTGRVTAQVTQTCVVTLEPFEAEVDLPVEIDFAPPPPDPADRERRSLPTVSRRRRGEAPSPAPMPVVDAGEDDPPDPIVNGQIDLGAITVEFLTLGLDFYPRKPGVAFGETVIGERDGAKASPFAALKQLKDRS